MGIGSPAASGGTVVVVTAVVVWSWMFEIALPRTSVMGRYCVADPWDITCYCLGALIAALVWRWWYRDASPSPT